MYFVAKPNTDALNFFSAANITDTTQCVAVATLVTDLKNFRLWDKMKAIYPFIGQAGVSSSFQFNLKDPTTFKGTFNGGWTFTSTGATPNGSTGYMNTGLNPSSTLSLNNSSVSFYTTTNQAYLANTAPFGAISDTVNYYGYQSYFRGVSGNYLISMGSPLTYIPNTTTAGLYVNTKTSSTSLKVFKNNTLFGENTNTDLMASQPTVNMWVGAINIANSISNPSDINFAFFSIGDGLTDTEAANLYTAVQRFQTTLGRQV